MSDDAEYFDRPADRIAKLEAALSKERARADKVEAEYRRLQDWQVEVTVALNRVGGAFYEDVPRHIVRLRAKLEASEKLTGELREALRKADTALSEAREMLGVFEDHGGHDGLGGKGYVATIDHMDEARKQAKCLLSPSDPATAGEEGAKRD